ncbi:malonyl-CoA decarboxylase [Delftia tsuruhatensis]|uniref:malonyl-CoA decarboxylase n=1 Tax=Delftia tsuruhatensis TaxID=180282 RepID=UPI0028999E50|nr:malonyl-CoA decarboxylase [Delftia tsuruhatensis]
MGLATDWIARNVSRFRSTEAAAPAKKAEGDAAKAPAPRGTAQRLQATLRRGQEVLSPRELRKLMEDLQAAADAALSDVEGGRHAQQLMDWYAQAELPARQDFWALIVEQFGPDTDALMTARKRYDTATSDAERGHAEMDLRRALMSPRTRLLQRFAQPQGGMGFLVDLRAELLALPKAEQQRFSALDAELEHLFSTWFDVALLELRRLSWDSPASLIEKLIQYEAVHDIRSWADLKNRLDSDRRCYGFFHPRMPTVPLIFVEVALVDKMSDSIAPLLDETAAASDLGRATTAIFYSISNTQTGLRGVSFGDSLIKHVVETLTGEFPRLRHFATLSPIPGLRAWIAKHGDAILEKMDERQRKAFELKAGGTGAEHLLAALDAPQDLKPDAPVRRALLFCAAHYLGRETAKGRPLDPVARFHLGNGARVERLNWAADLSAKGLKQSLGLMVNYLYDLKRLDKHRGLLAQGRIPVSSDIEALYK